MLYWIAGYITVAMLTLCVTVLHEKWLIKKKRSRGLSDDSIQAMVLCCLGWPVGLPMFLFMAGVEQLRQIVGRK